MGYHPEEQEVKTPEQLPLDFSARDVSTSQGEDLSQGAVVYRLDQFRETATKSTLAAVYDAIHEAVKHVNVRRKAPVPDGTDSQFY